MSPGDAAQSMPDWAEMELAVQTTPAPRLNPSGPGGNRSRDGADDLPPGGTLARLLGSPVAKEFLVPLLPDVGESMAQARNHARATGSGGHLAPKSGAESGEPSLPAPAAGWEGVALPGVEGIPAGEGQPVSLGPSDPARALAAASGARAPAGSTSSALLQAGGQAHEDAALPTAAYGESRSRILAPFTGAPRPARSSAPLEFQLREVQLRLRMALADLREAKEEAHAAEAEFSRATEALVRLGAPTPAASPCRTCRRGEGGEPTPSQLRVDAARAGAALATGEGKALELASEIRALTRHSKRLQATWHTLYSGDGLLGVLDSWETLGHSRIHGRKGLSCCPMCKHTGWGSRRTHARGGCGCQARPGPRQCPCNAERVRRDRSPPIHDSLAGPADAVIAPPDCLPAEPCGCGRALDGGERVAAGTAYVCGSLAGELRPAASYVRCPTQAEAQVCETRFRESLEPPQSEVAPSFKEARPKKGASGRAALLKDLLQGEARPGVPQDAVARCRDSRELRPRFSFLPLCRDRGYGDGGDGLGGNVHCPEMQARGRGGGGVDRGRCSCVCRCLPLPTEVRATAGLTVPQTLFSPPPPGGVGALRGRDFPSPEVRHPPQVPPWQRADVHPAVSLAGLGLMHRSPDRPTASPREVAPDSFGRRAYFRNRHEAHSAREPAPGTGDSGS